MIRRCILVLFTFFYSQTFAGSETPKANESYLSKAAEIQRLSSGGNFKATTGDYSAPVIDEANKVHESLTVCENKKKIADGACLESLSPSIVQFVSENGQFLTLGLLAGASIADQCSSLGDMLNKANLALTLYTAACKTAQAICESSCEKVEANLKELRLRSNEASKKISSSCSTDTTGQCQSAMIKAQEADNKIATNANEISKGVGGKITVCGEYKISTGNAMLGAITALQGMAKAKSCENATSNTAVAASCDDKTQAIYTTTNCQCVRGEKSAAECQNILATTSSIKPGTISLPKSAGLDTGGVGSIGDLGGLGADEFGSASTASAGGSAPPVDGGGGGGLGGGGGSGGGYAQDGAGNPKKLNANILGGASGGGGGGSSGAGPGYGVDSKLKEYMPGEKKDPNRTLASQLAKEVTPQAGRSNWEKVKLRYRDNLSTLLNK